MAGRRPKDKHFRLITGNPGKREIPEDLPEGQPGWPDQPTSLSKVGRAEWDRLAQLLEGEGRLTLADGPMLAGAAAAYEGVTEIRRRLKQRYLDQDVWLRLKTGERMQWEAYRKFCNDLCLSQGTRARARTTGKSKPSKFQAFAVRKGGKAAG